MYCGPDINLFAKKENTEEMKINENITVKYIYELYEKFKTGNDGGLPKNIQFFDCIKDFFSFKVGEIEGYEFLVNPIEIEIDAQHKIKIVCDSQLEYIKEKYKVDTINCQNDSTKLPLNFYYLFNHKDHKFTICSSDNYITFKNQEEINEYLIKYYNGFIDKVFKSPKNFEKNYEYYFNINNKFSTEYPFVIFDDINSSMRTNLVKQINKWEFGVFRNFFGSSGKGKSITLIGALKYGKKTISLGTLYINCKTMRVLYKNFDIHIMKQIFIDEIVFLLRNKFKEYSETCDKIKNFIFHDEYDFWNLIIDILKYIDKIKNYNFIIAFDQYNFENDIHKKLEEIKTEFLPSQKFKIIVFSSMNEKDIRKVKIDYIFNKEKKEEFTEITNICSEFNTNFDNKEFEIYNQLGKTMKAYNEINQIKNKRSTYLSLDEYYQKKTEKLKFKLFYFYKDPNLRKDLFYGDNKKIDFCECMGKILSFMPNEIYSKEELKNIIDKIPFRLFNIEEINENFIIKYSCPVVEQILNDIYRELIMKNNFRHLKDITKGSGAYGCIFEYAVIYYIIQKSKSDSKILFSFFNISKNLKVKKFVLNKNEKIENLIYEKHILDKECDYIIEQEVFCGKTLDFIIIKFINSEPFVYGFQVSIYKKKIYDLEELINSYENMKLLLKKYFCIDFKNENFYFGYIFNYEEVNSDRYSLMLEKCDVKSLTYCFFEPINQKFFDKKGKEIDNINNIVTNIPLESKPIKSMDDYVFYPLQINYEQYNELKLNMHQYETVTKLVKNRFGDKAKWKIIKKTDYGEFAKSYMNVNNNSYFYLCYNEPYIKIAIFKNIKIYNLLPSGDIEESNLDYTKPIYICKVQG